MPDIQQQLDTVNAAEKVMKVTYEDGTVAYLSADDASVQACLLKCQTGRGI